MIQIISKKYQRAAAFCLLFIFYMQTALAGYGGERIYAGGHNSPGYRRHKPAVQALSVPGALPVQMQRPASYSEKAKAEPAKQDYRKDILQASGPSQPEMQAFQSVNSNNMVDLFTGDFSYNIPLLDVGGYPVNIAYRSGVSMDQEASWVGLGWNINPGTITRNLRGLPDDFNGGADSIRKTNNVKQNKTIGITAGADFELTGKPLRLGGSLGVFHNNYSGWGLELGLNATINAGVGTKGTLTGGLSITDNSQEGLSLAPSLSYSFSKMNTENGIGGSLSMSTSYNNRTGLRSLQLSAGLRQYNDDSKNQKSGGATSQGGWYGSSYSTALSFATPSYTPTITLPMTSSMFSFTGKAGISSITADPNFNLNGYIAKSYLAEEDQSMALPAFGYLNYQHAPASGAALLDYNREKEIPYREKPDVPNIAIPSYTYDLFSITGEGTGGMFRAFRGDIGFVYDHYIKTKDNSDRLTIDLGFGPNLAHAGVDLNLNRSFTQNSPWLSNNVAGKYASFQKNNEAFEAVYFKNAGEKAINQKSYYKKLGGDDVVAVKLNQVGSNITATNFLNRYRNSRLVGQDTLGGSRSIKTERDKRGQVVSYLNAKEATEAGLSRYIDNYSVNSFNVNTCYDYPSDEVITSGTGLTGYYYNNRDLEGTASVKNETAINFDGNNFTNGSGQAMGDHFSIRWVGRLKAPVTGGYDLNFIADDGVRLWVNDTCFVNNWTWQAATNNIFHLNLEAGKFYDLRIEYFNAHSQKTAKFSWAYPGKTDTIVGTRFFYPPVAVDTFRVNNYLSKEKRVNGFRKSSHISEIDVLNTDGRRYVYGIPVYNLKQKDVTFSVSSNSANLKDGLAAYTKGVDDGTGNNKGKENYYSAEETPAYAHSFLLTGILSPDYVDLTNNGISDDDLGDAVKFNYSKVCGINNPFKWRAPFNDSATYNEGLKSYNRDDKGSYVYGEKELWYLNSIESKTMLATFVVENREDVLEINENGLKTRTGSAKRLKQINLYNKTDYLNNPSKARPVKTVHFAYSYELCKGLNKSAGGAYADSGKLTLKRIWFTYNGNSKGVKNPYVFSYHKNNPSYAAKFYDRWGNYKDPLNNPNSTAGNTVTNSDYPYALQDSTLAAYNAGAWALDSIVLPSGGKMKITYESDDYGYVQNRRAMQMFNISAFSNSPVFPSVKNRLYLDSDNDNLYVFIDLPSAVSSKQDLYKKYLEGINKLYFRLNVPMPATDKWGSGNEYIPSYAEIDNGSSGSDGYGIVNSTRIWIKLKGIDDKGNSGNNSPLATAAMQFLRLNLPSKTYPGSEVGDDLDLRDAVQMVFSLATNVVGAFRSFGATARAHGWTQTVDLNRTFIRLNNPLFKRYGGGHRVKKIQIFDNWNSMTGQKESVYGQEYAYTTTREINGVATQVSSGVASYEPMIGGEENPFREPIEYVEKVAPLAPVTLGYTEFPLGESFFPAAGVGYSKVRVRSLNVKNRKSANGYEETNFYTAYDFPTITEFTNLAENKKRYKSPLSDFLRVNAKHYLGLSQGFKIELNDMHGKMLSQATYPETDSLHPITYTENFYKVDNLQAENKHLANEVWAMSPDGSIDTTAIIGKDIELMMDMREQYSLTNGNNFNVNGDFFAIPAIPPFLLIPSMIGLAQREENLYRSAAVTKVIQRYGILDSVVHIDKGSKVSTENLLYDAETGEVLLTRTQNEFNDTLYNFSYPSHWSYDGMGLAYRNINTIVNGVTIRDGKISGGLAAGKDSMLFVNGDELLVAGKQKTGSGTCNYEVATFPDFAKAWVVNTNEVNGGAKKLYLLDEKGLPLSADSATLKVIRSGRKNMFGSVGTTTSLANPLRRNAGKYELVLDGNSKVVNASAAQFSHVWKTSTKCVYCGAPKEADGEHSSCLETIPATLNSTAGGLEFCRMTPHEAYSACGTYIYEYANIHDSEFVRQRISPDNAFWINNINTTGNCRHIIVDTLRKNQSVSQDNSGGSANPLPADSTDGPLNRAGLWYCPQGNTLPVNQWKGFSQAINIPRNGIFYLGAGGDNKVRCLIDGIPLKELSGVDNYINAFRLWHIYPVELTSGQHTIKIEGFNSGQAESWNVAGFGLEIYDNSKEEIINAHSYDDLNLIYSTKDAIGNSWYPNANYGCPAGYTLDTMSSPPRCVKSTAGSVKSNPFQSGVWGNWRLEKNYVYYGVRDNVAFGSGDIRNNGIIPAFAPFWNFQAKKLVVMPDTTKWVWNTKATLYNKKGFELENKDALGRFNAGLYGYDNTMPTAVIQNGSFQESAFEGFEDYFINTSSCNTICRDNSHFDFSTYLYSITKEQSHSGIYSLKIDTGKTAELTHTIDAVRDESPAGMSFTEGTNGCVSGSTITATAILSNSYLKPFTPIAGTRMVFSAWVKETKDCKCESYTGNVVDIIIKKSDNSEQVITATSSGKIIEGWQRIEQVVDIPANAVSVTMALKATGTSTVYYDDVRLHPFNAGMKSFVYHPLNLRLLTELDENNYATFYEYDDDGTLIRVKKETERGIKTIKETRSALIKN